jgi:hypothetical protein
MIKTNKFTNDNIKHDIKLNTETRGSIRQYATHVYDTFVKEATELHDKYIHGQDRGALLRRDRDVVRLLLFPDISGALRTQILRNIKDNYIAYDVGYFNLAEAYRTIINQEFVRLGLFSFDMLMEQIN